MLVNITVIDSEYEKKNGVWHLKNRHEHAVNEQYYKNVVDAKEFFIGIGGLETHLRGRTKFGTKTTKVISISPNRDAKHIWQFDFSTAQKVTE